MHYFIFGGQNRCATTTVLMASHMYLMKLALVLAWLDFWLTKLWWDR